jgi:hypothetical protein
MIKSAYVIFVAIIVCLQAAICSTSRPNTFTGTGSTVVEEDLDLGGCDDKLMGPPVGAVGGFMSRGRPIGGLPPRGAPPRSGVVNATPSTTTTTTTSSTTT